MAIMIHRKVDLNGDLHADNEPAYKSKLTEAWYRNGKRHGLTKDAWGTVCYFYKGVLVPKKYIVSPEKLTLKEVVGEPNTELRRIALEVHGIDRIEEEAAEIVDEDKSGQRLLKIEFKGKVDKEDRVATPAFMFVKVFNSTAEPDGSFKTYYLCVPPEMKRVKEAIAWTFRCEEKEYNPIHET